MNANRTRPHISKVVDIKAVVYNEAKSMLDQHGAVIVSPEHSWLVDKLENVASVHDATSLVIFNPEKFEPSDFDSILTGH